jgi:hypothetical protein
MATLTTYPPTLTGRKGAFDQLSFSATRLFQSCPLRFFFRYILGLPEETISASLVLGASLHQAIQYHFEQLLAGQPPADLDTLLGVFQDHWQCYEPPDDPVRQERNSSHFRSPRGPHAPHVLAK